MANLNKIDAAVELHLAYDKIVADGLAADAGVTPELEAACDAWLEATGDLSTIEFNIYRHRYTESKTA